jgi:hypothetical protein
MASAAPAVDTTRCVAGALFQSHDYWAGDWIRNAETADAILETVTKGIEDGNLRRVRLGERVHVGPLSKDALMSIGGLNHIDAPETRPSGSGPKRPWTTVNVLLNIRHSKESPL